MNVLVWLLLAILLVIVIVNWKAIVLILICLTLIGVGVWLVQLSRRIERRESDARKSAERTNILMRERLEVDKLARNEWVLKGDAAVVECDKLIKKQAGRLLQLLVDIQSLYEERAMIPFWEKMAESAQVFEMVSSGINKLRNDGEGFLRINEHISFGDRDRMISIEMNSMAEFECRIELLLEIYKKAVSDNRFGSTLLSLEGKLYREYYLRNPIANNSLRGWFKWLGDFGKSFIGVQRNRLIELYTRGRVD